MPTHDYNIANAAGIVFRADLNDSLSAIVSQNSSATEPTTLFAYMWWADTTTAILKQRNSLNTGWNSLYNLSTGQWLGSTAGNAATVTVADAAADTTTWPMLARSQTGDQAPTTDAGLTYDASTNTLTAGTFAGAHSGTFAGSSVASTGPVSSSSPTAGVGYAVGAGGSVTQVTSATTTVVLNKACGLISMVNNTFNAGTVTSFYLQSTAIGSYDTVVVAGYVATYPGKLIITTDDQGTGTVRISITNVTSSNITHALNIKFLVLKSFIT